MNRVTNLIFDFDGTIADTSQGVRESVAFALDSLSIKHSFIGDEVVGPSPFSLYKDYFKLDKNQVEKAVKLHRTYSESEAYKTAKLYEGVSACLKELKNEGIKLYIVSLKKETVIRKILKMNQIEQYFEKIIGITLNEKISKYELLQLLFNAVDVKNSLYIGDTEHDFECCNLLNLKFCFASYGYGRLKEKSLYRITTFYDLLDLI